MEKKNSVFIATSLDGYIADKNGGIDWLHAIPNPDNIDMGYGEFMEGIDALVMGRRTFETVCGFDIKWPYTKPVFVISSTLTELPHGLVGKVCLLKGTLTEILEHIHSKGLHRLYVDGGATIQSFLREDLIDEMILTTIPVLLGGGSPLFSEHSNPIHFELLKTNSFLYHVSQRHYLRVKKDS